MTPESTTTALVIPSAALLAHWQGHRRLTRRVITAFPGDQLFTFSLGGMRTFGEMALEMITMAVPMVQGIVSDTWEQNHSRTPRPASEVLELWDESTIMLDQLFPQIRPERFQETATAFGQWPGRVYDLLLYVIDNEIHHRGQGFVYLRALGINPPPFYERE